MLATDAEAADLGSTEAYTSSGAHHSKGINLTLLVAFRRIASAVAVST